MPDHAAFERERLRYCEAMFALEKERRLQIERYAQFFLGLITLVTGLVTLKGDLIRDLIAALTTPTTGWEVRLVQGEALLLLLTMLFSFVSIAAVFFPQARQKPYPRSLVTRMFRENDGGTPVSDDLEVKLVRDIALRYAIATERNSLLNTKKSKWLVAAASSCTAAVLLHAALAVTLLTNTL